MHHAISKAPRREPRPFLHHRTGWLVRLAAWFSRSDSQDLPKPRVVKLKPASRSEVLRFTA